MFPPSVQWTPVAKLSGGEKRRLQLLKVLMGAPNVLLLDEPTNDLDIQTLTVLEDYLDDFTGAVILVSHDRYFLDRLVGKIFAFEGDGKITQYVGGYSDYRAASILRCSQIVSNGKPADEKKTLPVQPAKDRPRKFTFKEQREFEQIDDIIAGVESELQAVTGQLDGAGSDYELLRQLTIRQQELERQLDELLERWTYLNELAEEIHIGEKR
jgi:ATP-binding cassette subfamily F protein uup